MLDQRGMSFVLKIVIFTIVKYNKGYRGLYRGVMNRGYFSKLIISRFNQNNHELIWS